MKYFLVVLAFVNAFVFFKNQDLYIKTILPLSSVIFLAFYGFLSSQNKSIKIWFKNNIKILCFMTIYFFIFLPQIFKFTIWSEEQGWINIAIDILQGTRKDILTPKSDYPSSLASWPLALVMYVFKDPIISSRLTGFLYLIGSFYFISGIGAIFLNIKKKPIIPAIFFGLSTSPILYVFTGWHEITYIPLLIFGTYYYLFKNINFEDKTSLIFYAIFSGISMWSLYMPCLVATVSSILFLIYPKFKIINLEKRINYLIYLSPLVSPFIAIISKQNMLDRHKFLLFNKGAQLASLQNNRLIAWANSFKNFILDTVHIDTWGNILIRFDHYGLISLGPICTLLFIIFISYLIVKRNFNAFYFMFFPFVILITILMFSNPNYWREHFLYELIIIMCVYEFSVIYNWLKNKENNKKLVNYFLIFIIIVHSCYFFNRYLQLLSFWPPTNFDCYSDAQNGTKIASFLRQYVKNNNCKIFYPSRGDYVYARAMLGYINKEVLNFGESGDINVIRLECGDNENITLDINEILNN